MRLRINSCLEMVEKSGVRRKVNFYRKLLSLVFRFLVSRKGNDSIVTLINSESRP